MCTVKLRCRRIQNCYRNPQIVSGIRNFERIAPKLAKSIMLAESAYICGTRINWLYSLVAESATKKCADEIYVAVVCAQNPRKFCKWKPLTFWKTFEDFKLDFSNL